MKNLALLVVDVQVGLVEWIPPEVRGSVLPKIGALIAKARASGAPVMYIQRDGSKHWSRVQWAGQFTPSFSPCAPEHIIRKRESDSFFETTLQEELKKRGSGIWSSWEA
jgi:nicotinamidase-related amidase